MITTLLRKQLEKELELIYANVYSFVENFFGKEEAEYAAEEIVTYFMAFTHEGLYIQKYWIDEDSDAQVQEVSIEYDKFNEWSEGLINE